MANSKINLEELFDKKWKVESFDIEGQNFVATNVGKKDHTIFFRDNKAASYDKAVKIESMWKFDSKNNTFTLYSKGTQEASPMRILLLNESEFVFETVNENEMTMVVHMVNSGG